MKAIVTFAVTALMASTSWATVIVQYGSVGNTTSLAASAANRAVTADNLTAGSGIGVQSLSTFNFTNWATNNASYADAVADNEFFQWGFDVKAGHIVDLATLDIRVDRSSTGPDDLEIKVSVNGGPAVSVLTHDYNDSTSGVNLLNIDLSAIPQLSAGDSVVFTLAAWNSESNTGSFDLETITSNGSDAIVVNGTVAPEPGSLALMGLGGLLIARRRHDSERV